VITHHPMLLATGCLGAITLAEAVALEVSFGTITAAGAGLGVGVITWLIKRELANKDRAIDRLRASDSALYSRIDALDKRVSKIETERNLLGR